MKALFWLLASGVLWLGLVQIAPQLGVPSQIVSLARSGYIGIFSIYLMVELRESDRSASSRPTHLYLYLLPLVSLLLLAAFSSDFVLTPALLAMIGCFYLCAFAVINIRSERGEIRQAGWDLLAPGLLLLLMLDSLILIIGGVAALIYFAFVLRRPVDRQDATHLDALVVQLPSICIAPVVLIALRDVFDGGGAIDRTHVESFGLVVNGVGAAVWTAMVMRVGMPLARVAMLAMLLWLVSFAAALLGAFLPQGIIISAGAILVAEGFRGAIWLGATAAMVNLPRSKGFAANLIATVLPLAALWIGKSYLTPAATLLTYAGFVLPIPLAAWLILRGKKPSVDEPAGQFDEASLAASVLERKA